MSIIKRALISVSDKSGIVEFAKGLLEFNVEILSTGGTASLLKQNDIPVIDVADYTGFAEMLDGRLKTLHPKIHGGLLGKRDLASHVEAMQANDIPPIDLVVVNLYPFEKTVAQADCSLDDAIENIDIGGPTMLRAAAKNYQSVTVVVDNGDCPEILNQMRAHDGATTLTYRYQLAAKTFSHTAYYDGIIANYLSQRSAGKDKDAGKPFGDSYSTQFIKIQDMRYGENPHQQAAFYRQHNLSGNCIANTELLQGKALSYNNIADADTALECVKSFSETACVIVKHANPCGVAVGDSVYTAYEKAYATDPTSAFGGIIAFNRTLDEKTATTIIDRQFVEVIITPDIDKQAQAVLSKKNNIRVLVCRDWGQDSHSDYDYKRVGGGLLIQEFDRGVVKQNNLEAVSQRKPTESEISDLLFAWKVCKYVKSNAIVYCQDGQTIGVGAGQMSRVYSAKIAAIKAADEDLEVKGSVMASDAFFPFRDGIDQAADVGITAVIQPGGSKRDDEVVAAANEHDIAMVFTGMRHFRH